MIGLAVVAGLASAPRWEPACPLLALAWAPVWVRGWPSARRPEVRRHDGAVGFTVGVAVPVAVGEGRSASSFTISNGPRWTVLVQLPSVPWVRRWKYQMPGSSAGLSVRVVLPARSWVSVRKLVRVLAPDHRVALDVVLRVPHDLDHVVGRAVADLAVEWRGRFRGRSSVEPPPPEVREQDAGEKEDEDGATTPTCPRRSTAPSIPCRSCSSGVAPTNERPAVRADAPACARRHSARRECWCPASAGTSAESGKDRER